MAKPDESYEYAIIESYEPSRAGSLHGKVHIRPCPGQGYPTSMHVECSKKLSRDYRVDRAKLTDREGGGEFLYSRYRWRYEVLPPNKS